MMNEEEIERIRYGTIKKLLFKTGEIDEHKYLVNCYYLHKIVAKYLKRKLDGDLITQILFYFNDERNVLKKSVSYRHFVSTLAFYIRTDRIKEISLNERFEKDFSYSGDLNELDRGKYVTKIVERNKRRVTQKKESDQIEEIDAMLEYISNKKSQSRFKVFYPFLEELKEYFYFNNMDILFTALINIIISREAISSLSIFASGNVTIKKQVIELIDELHFSIKEEWKAVYNV